MICTNNPYSGMFEDLETVNRQVLNEIMNFPDSLRKEIRLLAKQYELLSIKKEPDDRASRYCIKEGNYILKYKNFGQRQESNSQPIKDFEWIITAERMRG